MSDSEVICAGGCGVAAAVQGTAAAGSFEVLCTRSNSDRGHLYEPSVINAVKLVECVECVEAGSARTFTGLAALP